MPLDYVWPCVALRFALDAFICSCVPPGMLSHSPLPLPLLVCALGVTTGWMATSIITQAGLRVEPRERETMGYLSILAIFLGFICGSTGAIPLKAFLWSD